jgi:hypothetical protein
MNGLERRLKKLNANFSRVFVRSHETIFEDWRGMDKDRNQRGAWLDERCKRSSARELVEADYAVCAALTWAVVSSQLAVKVRGGSEIWGVRKKLTCKKPCQHLVAWVRRTCERRRKRGVKSSVEIADCFNGGIAVERGARNAL